MTFSKHMVKLVIAILCFVAETTRKMSNLKANFRAKFRRRMEARKLKTIKDIPKTTNLPQIKILLPLVEINHQFRRERVQMRGRDELKRKIPRFSRILLLSNNYRKKLVKMKKKMTKKIKVMTCPKSHNKKTKTIRVAKA